MPDVNVPPPVPVDAETALAHAAPGDKDDLRLWLRLLSCTRLIEAEIRRRLRGRGSALCARGPSGSPDKLSRLRFDLRRFLL